METRVIWRTVTRPWPALLASAVNMGLLPLFAWILSWFLAGDMAVGLIIASVVPCTLASAAVWTRRAGGNDAAALLVTILTNVSCFIVTPMWLYILLEKSVSMNVGKMSRELAFLVVAPILLGQLFRYGRSIAQWSTGRRHEIGILAQVGILCMVLIGSIQSGQRLNAAESNLRYSASTFAMMIVGVIVVHLTAMLTGRLLARVCGMGRENSIAVAIAGSQKTLMVGVHIAVDYFGGLTILPMVAYHVAQLILDTIIVDRWNRAFAPQADK
jgi:sodium/bile acid cotransporter 7